MTDHCPVRIDPSGAKFVAVCSCGWRSSPRVSQRAALDAIECEHGWTSQWWARDGDDTWNATAKIAALTEPCTDPRAC